MAATGHHAPVCCRETTVCVRLSSLFAFPWNIHEGFLRVTARSVRFQRSSQDLARFPANRAFFSAHNVGRLEFSCAGGHFHLRSAKILAMSALPRKADFRKGPCLLYPSKRTCAVH
jgi:hypothetical protein